MAARVKVARQQTTPELSGTFRTLPPEPTPTRARTLQNPPEPSGSCLRNLHQHTPEPSGTLRNLPEPASGTYTSTHRNSPEPSGTLRNLPEPSGTCLRNPHHFIPELSETFRNFPPEPAPATRTGTHRSLSGLKTPLAYAVGEKGHDSKCQQDSFNSTTASNAQQKEQPSIQELKSGSLRQINPTDTCAFTPLAVYGSSQ